MYIGLDIGKSKVAAGLITEQGRIRSKAQLMTDMQRGGEMIVDQCRNLVRRMLAASDGKPMGIGIGSSGIVDHDLGVIVSSGTIPGWHDIHIKSMFEREFGMPVFVENDVCVAALGEHIFGASHGAAVSVFLSIGTGVGFCTIRNGIIWHGAHNLAGQIAHIRLFGKESTVNDLFGGKGISENASKQLGREIRTEEVFRLASQGIEQPRQILERALEAAALTVAWIQNSIDPEVIVLGGGVALNEDAFLGAIRSKADEFLAKYGAQLPSGVNLVPALLGDDSGIMGGMALCLRKGEHQ
jgi:glucokinase